MLNSRDLNQNRPFIASALRCLHTSDMYGPAGNAKGEPGHEAKTNAIHYAVIQGIVDSEDYREYLETMGRGIESRGSAARDIVAALAEAGFRITRAPRSK